MATMLQNNICCHTIILVKHMWPSKILPHDISHEEFVLQFYLLLKTMCILPLFHYLLTTQERFK